jgi:UDP-glucose 4-epimerase
METTDSSQLVILITGSRGQLGSRVVPILAKNYPRSEIIVLARTEKQSREDNTQAKAIIGDLRDEKLWLQIPKTVTHVVHLAAVIPWRIEDHQKASVVTDNLLPLAHLIESSQSWPKLRQVINSSSVSVYAQTAELLSEDSLKRPSSLYGATKLAGEQLLCCLDARGVKTVSLRFSSLYAHGQYQGTVLPIMVGRALEKQPILVFGDGRRTQDFLHCEDAARALLLCLQKEARGIYNVGSGIPVTMTELAQTISRVLTGGKARVVCQPAEDQDPGIKLDISKARRELGYEPQISLERGLEILKKEIKSRDR